MRAGVSGRCGDNRRLAASPSGGPREKPPTGFGRSSGCAGRAVCGRLRSGKVIAFHALVTFDRLVSLAGNMTHSAWFPHARAQRNGDARVVPRSSGVARVKHRDQIDLVHRAGVLGSSGSKCARLPTGECRYVGPFRSSGDERIRTADLCDANAALSQLSYVPGLLFVVAAQGVEPRTSRI